MLDSVFLIGSSAAFDNSLLAEARALGYQVNRFADVASGISEVKLKQPKVAIMGLAGLKKSEVEGSLRGLSGELQTQLIFLLTGPEQAQDLHALAASPTARLLQAPVSLQDLLTILRQQRSKTSPASSMLDVPTMVGGDWGTLTASAKQASSQHSDLHDVYDRRIRELEQENQKLKDELSRRQGNPGKKP